MIFKLQKLTFESGCCVLEKEFRNVLSADSVVADAKTVVNCLDQDYGSFHFPLPQFILVCAKDFKFLL